MEKMRISASKYTPEIIYDPATYTLSIEGESWPENAFDIYMPLLEKLEAYFRKPGQSLKVDVMLDLMNTSSRIMYRELINLLQRAHDEGHSVEMKWFYQAGDEDMQEDWEELMEDCSLPYHIVEREE
jgi:hypothetical protein